MPYPKSMVKPMREELTRLGIAELLEPEEVDEAMETAQEGTSLVVINSVCGCAAKNARPAVQRSMEADVQPDRYFTVFAGQHLEATERMREHLKGIPPSSPFMVLFKDGSPVYVLERRHIEGRSAQAIAEDLVGSYEKYCGADGSEADGLEQPDAEESGEAEEPPSTFRSIM